jgi:hypothetical protein
LLAAAAAAAAFGATLFAATAASAALFVGAAAGAALFTAADGAAYCKQLFLTQHGLLLLLRLLVQHCSKICFYSS